VFELQHTKAHSTVVIHYFGITKAALIHTPIKASTTSFSWKEGKLLAFREWNSNRNFCVFIFAGLPKTNYICMPSM